MFIPLLPMPPGEKTTPFPKTHEWKNEDIKSWCKVSDNEDANALL